MMKFSCPFSCPSAPSAKVVDGKLVLFFPDSLRPTLWQMDMGQASASALEVDGDEEAGEYRLVLKTLKDDAHVIAAFDSKEKAVKALTSVSRALSHAHGKIRPAASVPAGAVAGAEGTVSVASAGEPPSMFKLLAGVSGIVILLMLILVLWNMSPRPPATLASSPAPVSSGAVPTDSAGDTGVPLSADDFLRRQ